jgi:hypothetical protein
MHRSAGSLNCREAGEGVRGRKQFLALVAMAVASLLPAFAQAGRLSKPKTMLGRH